MADVLISIRPEWVKKIISGEKTVELRRSAPKMPTPFRCFIYETQGSGGSGKVIGVFTCREITHYFMVGTERSNLHYVQTIGHRRIPVQYEPLQLTEHEMKTYGNGSRLYGWHISSIRVFNEPKPLSVFHRPCANVLFCESCGMFNQHPEPGFCGNAALQISRPPQSWCYVEEQFYA